MQVDPARSGSVQREQGAQTLPVGDQTQFRTHDAHSQLAPQDSPSNRAATHSPVATLQT